MATTGHLFEEMMATFHSLGIAGKVVGKSCNTQWAFRQLWKKCGVELNRLRPQQCADILWHLHISATSAVCSGWTAMLSLPGVNCVSHGGDWPPFEDMTATYHQPSIAGCCGTVIQHPVGVPAALEEIRCGTSPAERDSRDYRSFQVFSSLR